MIDEIPEEIAILEDAKVQAAFHRLNIKQQNFLLAYLHGETGAEAYRQSYNEMADDHVAAVSGSRLLTNVDMKIVLEAFQDDKDEDLVLIKRTFRAAIKDAVKPVYGKDSEGQPEKIEDLPDHLVRIKAASELAKLHGLNAPEKKEISGSVTILATPLDALI